MSFDFTIGKGRTSAQLGAVQAKTQETAETLGNISLKATSGFAAKAMLGKLEAYHAQGHGI